MLTRDPVTGRNGQCLPVYRGAVGIWLALETSVPEGSGVIVPANLCWAAVLPVLYAGMKPVFCDVDAASGNLRLRDVQAVLTENTRALIAPHMYGNPIAGLPEIAEMCREKGIVLIEDCASFMGGSAADYEPGTVGDYILYSTGYSKTVSAGVGGLLVSFRHSLEEAERLERQLPPSDDACEKEWTLFSRMYRVLRNGGQDTVMAQTFFEGFRKCARPLMLRSIREEEKDAVLAAVGTLPDAVRERRECLAAYEKALEGVPVKRYAFAEGAVPWRLCLTEEPERRKALIAFCLELGLPVSDWYPRVTPVFGDSGEYPGAAEHEARIVNFPIPCGAEETARIADELKRFYSESKQRREMR